MIHHPEDFYVAPECPLCGADMVKIDEFEYECSVLDCLGTLDTEPDWDAMTGGADDDDKDL